MARSSVRIGLIRKAVADYKCFNKGGIRSPHYGVLMFDRSTGDTWTDYFYSEGHRTWRQYEKSSIVNLGKIITYAGEEITVENVKAFAYDEYGKYAKEN